MEKIKLKVGDVFNFTKVSYLYYKIFILFSFYCLHTKKFNLFKKFRSTNFFISFPTKTSLLKKIIFYSDEFQKICYQIYFYSNWCCIINRIQIFKINT